MLVGSTGRGTCQWQAPAQLPHLCGAQPCTAPCATPSCAAALRYTVECAPTLCPTCKKGAAGGAGPACVSGACPHIRVQGEGTPAGGSQVGAACLRDGGGQAQHPGSDCHATGQPLPLPTDAPPLLQRRLVAKQQQVSHSFWDFSCKAAAANSGGAGPWSEGQLVTVLAG